MTACWRLCQCSALDGSAASSRVFQLFSHERSVCEYCQKVAAPVHGHPLGVSLPQVCPGLVDPAPAQLEEKCWPTRLAEGDVFELNNNLPHRVRNNSTMARIHLIIDAGAVPHSYIPLKPGQVCKYQTPDVVC